MFLHPRRIRSAATGAAVTLSTSPPPQQIVIPVAGHPLTNGECIQIAGFMHHINARSTLTSLYLDAGGVSWSGASALMQATMDVVRHTTNGVGKFELVLLPNSLALQQQDADGASAETLKQAGALKSYTCEL